MKTEVENRTMKTEFINNALSKLRRITIVVASLICISISSFSQDDKKEKIEAMKVAFITQKLDLNSKEAQVFWPVYNDYQDKLQAIRKQKRKDAKSGRTDIETMNDNEVEQMIDNEIQSKIAETELLKEYHIKFKQILGVKKVARLYRAEEDFKRELLKQLQNK